MSEINVLLIFIIASALIAVEAKDLLSGVIAIGAAGIGLSMAFLVLKAPELAILQLVVEILALIVLISATIKRDLPFSTSGRWLFNTISTFVFVIVFLGCAHEAFKALPQFGQSREIGAAAQIYVTNAATISGERNIVSAILHDRVFDSVAEFALVFAAVVGVLAVGRRNAKTHEAPHE